MATRHRRPSGHQFTHNFQELALVWHFADGVAWRCGLVDGQFEVTFDESGEWFFSNLAIAMDNGKVAGEALGRLIHLDADIDERIYLAILDALELRYSDFVEERVADELAAHGIRVAA